MGYIARLNARRVFETVTEIYNQSSSGDRLDVPDQKLPKISILLLNPEERRLPRQICRSREAPLIPS